MRTGNGAKLARRNLTLPESFESRIAEIREKTEASSDLAGRSSRAPTI